MNIQLQEPVQYVKVKRPKSAKNPDTQKEIMKIIVEEKHTENLKLHIESNPVDVNDSPLSHLGDYTEEPFTIIESYFRGQHLERLVRHQIESYNHFINFQVLRTIQMFNPVNIRSENDFVPENGQYFLEMFVSFENFRLYPPQIHENNGATKLMLPQEARLRNFTYASNMSVDLNIQYVIRNTDKMDAPKIINKTLPKINIGKMPIMTKSSICVLTQNSHVSHEFTGECPMDCGGCFIIKGSEKTVLGQERAAENKIYCFDGKNTTKWSWFAEIKSVPDFKCISPKQVEMMIASKNNGFGNGIYITIPRIKQPIELFTLFRALGIMTDKEICQYIVLDLENVKCQEVLKFLQASIIDANKYMTQEDALRHITASVAYTPMNMDKETGAIKKREFAMDALNNDLFPHCKTMEQKLYLVGYMANKLIQTSFGWKPPDDRDSYINKRVELTGTLLNNLFRNYFNKLVKEMQKHVVREINNGSWRSTEDYENIINMTNIYKILKSTTIENGITRALSTGDFSIKQTNSSKVGVAQVLNRLTYASCLSHLRRINTPLEKSGELIAPRKLHGTTWGFLCPAETPEGQSIGCVKSISCLGHITIPTNSSSLYTYVEEYVVKLGDMKSSDLFDKVKVFINGAWVGIAKDPVELYNEMKSKKHKGIINIYTSIIFDYRAAEIRICSDGGRLSRPVLRVKDGKALITKDIIDRLSRKELSWNDLLTSCKLPEAVIEYIDPDEQNWSMIAMKDKDTKDTSTTIEYTHCEIHPSTIFGVLSSCTPFPDNNQAPRNTYQCLHVDETVLLSDGRRIRIADVKIGDEVVSFNPDTFKMSNTKVINQYVRTTDKKIYEIITKSGRKIKATEDHKFMTSDGWKRVDQINIATDRIGVYSEQNAVNNTSLDYSVIDNDIFKDKLKCMGVSDKLIYKYSVELEKHGLLPIRSENNKLYIIARIFGFVLSDGSLNVYTRKDGRVICQSQFDFGTVNDATKFENDVELCGFRRCAPAEGFRQLNNTIHHTFSVSHNGALPALLLALDATYGKKTETNRKPIPDWIMNGSDLVKREFISGFQGGDGCKIRFNKMYKRGYNYVCGETSQQINPMLKDSLRTFMEQCVSLISGFGIDVSGCKENNICETRIKLSFKISDTQSNLIRYFDTIGYRYAETKTMTSARIIEYLKMLDSLRLERQCAIQTIRQLYDEGKTNQQIATITGTQINRVSDAIRSYKNGRIISSSNLGENSIENWIATVDIKEACMLVPILSITEIENCIISDITVESDNHSFIAGNNFMSSNCAMAKQALGVYALNFNQRMDKTAYVLTNPSRPLVDTRLMNFIHLNQIPSGCQIHVAIMAHTGYNMEDSVLVNKGSIDRGLFSATIYHTEKDEDKNIIRDEIIRCKPDPSKTRGIKFGNYDKLNAQGFMPENTLIEDRDIIIAKIIPIKEARNDPTKLIKYEDQSHAYSTSEDTYVDKNYTGRNGDGYNFAKVRTRVHRKPRFGDKFSSRHGQKGTCGNIIPEEDMPFTKEGLKPDIIINPHAIPSRMTIGQLKETLLGKVLLELGMFGDGTSFGNLDVKTIAEELQKLGYESYGNEVMYNGLTGEQLETSIFIGPVFYQRLKHMTNDKVHSRATGPMVSLTHQPAEGRSRAGGLRIGEMERDVLISHGATRFCKERLFDVSDKYQVNVCKKCGMIAACNDGNNNTKFYTQSDFTVHSCKTCGNKTDFALVDMPYANKLLFQELQTINVVPRILTD